MNMNAKEGACGSLKQTQTNTNATNHTWCSLKKTWMQKKLRVKTWNLKWFNEETCEIQIDLTNKDMNAKEITCDD